MKSFLMVLFAGLALTASSLARAQEALVLQGNLQGGMMGIGGETTGFVLEAVPLEVDLEGIENAADLSGQSVRLQGFLTMKSYVERGLVPVFKVVAAKLASDSTPFPAAEAAPVSGEPASPPQPAGTIRSRDEMRAVALDLLEHDAEFRAEVEALLDKTRKSPPK